MCSVTLALFFCFTSYLTLTLLVINVYGEQNIEKNLFDNLTRENNLLSVGIRLIFLVIFLNNIPFLFYPGKLSVLNALLEYKVRYFSRILQSNMLNSEESNADDFERFHQPAQGKTSQVLAGPTRDSASCDAPYSYDSMNEANELTSSSNEAINNVINDCDEASYYSVCIIYISLIVLCAVTIDDLTLVFGLIGAFSETMLNFVFPGLFFLIGHQILKKQQHSDKILLEDDEIGDDDNFQPGFDEKRKQARKCTELCRQLPVVLFILTGMGFFFTSNYFNILKILRL